MGQLMLIPKPGMDITTVVGLDITEDTKDTVDTTDTPTDHTHTVTTENAQLIPPLKLMLMLLPTIMVDTMDIPDTDTDTVWDIDHTMVDTADTVVDTTGARRRMSVTIPSKFV